MGVHLPQVRLVLPAFPGAGILLLVQVGGEAIHCFAELPDEFRLHGRRRFVLPVLRCSRRSLLRPLLLCCQLRSALGVGDAGIGDAQLLLQASHLRLQRRLGDGGGGACCGGCLAFGRQRGLGRFLVGEVAASDFRTDPGLGRGGSGERGLAGINEGLL